MYGLQGTLVGMLVGFAGLVILIGCVKVMERCTFRRQKKNIAPEPAPQAQPAAPVIQAAQPAGDDTLLAVITAAISAALAMETGVQPGPGAFTVRSIRRVNNAPAWNRAGREEQIYSRF